jgi:hypothetical protein
MEMLCSFQILLVRGEFKDKVQCLNNLNMVIVGKKLFYNGFSALTRTDQNCHSKHSINHLRATDKWSLLVEARTPSQSSERNFKVFKFFVQENDENKYCLLRHKKLCCRRILTFCAGVVKL